MTSPQFNQVEAHETIYNNSTYSMRPIEILTIAPNSSIQFKPKSKHLMLMMPQVSLFGLKQVELELMTDNNQVIQIIAPVKDYSS